MSEKRRIASIALVILTVLGAGLYYWLKPGMQAETVLPDDPTPVDSAASPPAGPLDDAVPDHYPLPATNAEQPLPGLADSDAPFGSALAALISSEQLASLLVSEQLIRKLVVTTDNLPRSRLSMNSRAIRRLPGEFMVHKRDGNITLNPDNETRYLPLLTLLRTIGVAPLAQLYLRFYPLFDEAYRELGYPDRHFNDRLVQVIDHLLASPVVDSPIALVQPSVFYEFADTGLEARSAGQKMMIRMGAANQVSAKQLLKDFRAEVTGNSAPVVQ